MLITLDKPVSLKIMKDSKVNNEFEIKYIGVKDLKDGNKFYFLYTEDIKTQINTVADESLLEQFSSYPEVFIDGDMHPATITVYKHLKLTPARLSHDFL